MAVALVLILGLGSAYGIHAASYADRFAVSEVDVSGTAELPPRLVQTYVESVLYDGSYGFLSRANVFTYPRDVLEQAVAGFFPRIKSATISRQSLLAQSVMVTVEERTPYGTWCADAACFVLDDTGFIFASASSTTERPRSQYRFAGGLDMSRSPIGQTFASTHMPGLIVLLDTLSQDAYVPLGVTVTDEHDFSVALERGFSIKASFGAEAHKLVRDMRLILGSDDLQGKEGELEYVDLRFGNRVYYKLKGQTAPEAAVSQQ